MVLIMTMEYLYCKATGQEMEEKKRWFQFWKDDDIKEKEEDPDDDDSCTSSSQSTNKDRDSSKQSTDDNSNIRVLTLNLPSDSDKLGIAFHDNKKTSMTELAYIDQSSPVYDQIPTELHKGWYVISLESSSIGKVQPKDADECVDCIARARSAKDTKLEMVLRKV
jgi:hypothetical protein